MNLPYHKCINKCLYEYQQLYLSLTYWNLFQYKLITNPFRKTFWVLSKNIFTHILNLLFFLRTSLFLKFFYNFKFMRDRLSTTMGKFHHWRQPFLAIGLRGNNYEKNYIIL